MMNTKLSAAMLTLCVLLHALPTHAQQTVSGTVTQVQDGDTVRLGDQKIRLWGADALELRQQCMRSDGTPWSCGQSARSALVDLVMHQTITCTVRGRSWDRWVARCEAQGVDLAQHLVRLGWAFDCARYSRGTYADDQHWAEHRRVGAWSGHFEWPWLTRPRPGRC